MVLKPSLFWNIHTEHVGKLSIDLAYITEELRWTSDYVVSLTSNEKLNIGAWITIDNSSGTTYENADISVVAGNINYNVSEYRDEMMYVKRSSASYDNFERNIDNEELSGYHLYHIPFKETIQNNEQKQIAFIDKTDIPYVKYIENNSIFMYEIPGEYALTFDQYIEFNNNEKIGLGIPLPNGKVRIYKKDSSGTDRLVGGDTINDTPKDENVRIKLGQHFDITGTEVIVNRKKTKGSFFVSSVITVNNRSNEFQVVKLQKGIPANEGKLTIEDNSDKLVNCERKKISIFLNEYTLQLEPNQSIEIEVNYTVLSF